MPSIGVSARRARLEAIGYWYYRQSRLATARLIARLRGFGKPLVGIASVLATPEPRRPRWSPGTRKAPNGGSPRSASPPCASASS